MEQARETQQRTASEAVPEAGTSWLVSSPAAESHEAIEFPAHRLKTYAEKAGRKVGMLTCFWYQTSQ